MNNDFARARGWLLLAAFGALCPEFAWGAEESPAAATEPRATQSASPFVIAHEKYTLPNGLEVLLHRDESLPLVTVNLWYHVGATHEPAGKSGFAHLFEHLMFEGSKHAGSQFDMLLESVGATNVNGTTSWDRTNYFETVPSEHLELALWLEADRMGFMIDLLTEERLEVQRDVVKNERLQSYDNAPYGPSWLKIYEELFPPGHPYRGAVIGSMEDLSRASMQDVREFFQRYYAPGNATLCLAGHFDPGEARRMIERHFGSLPARGGRAIERADVPSLKTTGTRTVVREPVELAQIIWAWHVPPAYSADEAALEIATEVLASGKASRLYQALVVPGFASQVSASLDSNRLGSVLFVDAMVASGRTVPQVEAELERVLTELRTAGPAAAELARAKVSLRLGLASDLQRLNSGAGEGGRAGLLQRLNHYLGDPGALPRLVEAQQAVTPDDLKRVLGAYLQPEKRVSVITLPEDAPGDGPNSSRAPSPKKKTESTVGVAARAGGGA